ncbi:hypothetical protein [Streptococcus gallolyticus]|uniref:hypothetical protein n=1 Tax=Streptococcus gallolyticus TaxID=315405 RepID=UPI0022833361|nr:hypothetical protein [Streptococcus gallolyticus]MCY7187313.1 hypothetical protein [Streptococcus gallolyticus subsp. gallolyticus]
MKEITNNEAKESSTAFVFAFDIPETDTTKGRDNVKVTIYLPDYVAFDKKLDTEYLEVVAKLLAEADWNSIAIDEYFGEDFEGNTIGIPDEDWEYNVDYRGVSRIPFIERLKEISVNYYDQQDLDSFMEALPTGFRQDTRPIIQVLNKIKRAYHPRTGYDSPDWLENAQAEELYSIAVSRFDEHGNFKTGSQPYSETGKNDYRTPNYWYAVRELLSVGEFTKHQSRGILYIESAGFKMQFGHVKGDVRFSVFEDEQFFNHYMMDFLTTVTGNFVISEGYHDIEEESNKLLELCGTYKVYHYKDNLFAFVNKGENKGKYD